MLREQVGVATTFEKLKCELGYVDRERAKVVDDVGWFIHVRPYLPKHTERMRRHLVVKSSPCVTTVQQFCS